MKVRTSRRSRNVVLEIEPGDTGFVAASAPGLRLKQILVAVDFSESSRKALRYALSFARLFGAEITLLHVVEIVPARRAPLAVSRDAETREMAARTLATWRRDARSGSSIKAVTRTGISACHEIVAAAEESNADLLVIGNHGRTGLARVLLGSTAERVVRHAPCPVLVARERERDFLTDDGR